MEQKIKNQYSYFVYPFVVDEKKYEDFILKMIQNKNCKMKFWNKEKDLSIYTYLNQNIRDNLFWSFQFSSEKIKKLNELDNDLKSKLLSQYETIFFDYNIDGNIQGKIGKSGAFLFDINKIEIICFKSGICFFVVKTTLGKETNIEEVLNFNNIIRTLGNDCKTINDEEIRIQSDSLMDVINISDIVKNIVGQNKDAKSKKYIEEKILTYTYVCTDDNNWNNESDINNFIRLYKIIPSDSKILNPDECKKNQIDLNENIKFGVSKQGTGIYASNRDPVNILKMPYVFGEEYFYTYLITLYKKILLNKISIEFNETKKFDKTKEKLSDFSDNIWVYKITNDEQGQIILKKWEEKLQVQFLYEKLKNNMIY